MSEGTCALPPALLSALRSARRVTAFTGAGISSESGVPTFRDAQTGLWAQFRPEDLATPAAFARDPKRVWEWYAWRRQRMAEVAPNAGHWALAELERRVPTFTLVTQNVDGLHHRAGSRRLIELHGNLTRTKCFEEDLLVEQWEDSGDVPPRCPRCGGRLRPDVVWFGEMLPAGAFEQALAASQQCDVFLSVGTSTVVYPAASLPFEAAEAGATVVEVNPEPTPLTPRASYSFRAPAGQFLPALVRAAWPA